jgi:uridine kinase
VTACIIAIAGPSGSGKSLFAERLLQVVQEELPQAPPALLREDAYYRDQAALSFAEREAVNYDHPDALEHSLLAAHLDALRAGDSVAVPRYDYSRHTRRPECDTVRPAPVIIVEGILLLSDAALRQRFDIRFFMDTPLDICLLRRIDRDLRERGRNLSSVTEQYERTVRPMYQQYIAPSAAHADMLITGGGLNTVALQVVCDLVLARLRGAAEQAP